ncbi:quinone oxidoreductase [Ventosimonas gracilis]|uniref:Quinone oxidoreductase n=1 Tax=Ventosimonas gracilis TaxID=1680762 RepID=A0A139SMD5_9GAMM|nr:YhdH/YhfP family quinone oxidoreductase [Ventosimonas gracilis]KXU35743.1 quinone oxidoreductase [Ventosimonas gracilis]
MPQFNALWISKNDTGGFTRQIIKRSTEDLPKGELLIRVNYSSLNYKDALSASGHAGVTKQYPHTPGIDAAGVVERSQVKEFAEGDEVIVTGYGLGMNSAGGFAQFIRIPASWAVKRPPGLTLRQCMCLGTAGLTAALCLDKLQQAGVKPESGAVLVTGASGGVGSIAVALLAAQGYQVTAVTAKSAQEGFLKSLGARQILPRSALQEGTDKPLLKEQWAGAVDCVGGDMLFNLIKSLRYGGSVACCGLTAGVAFNATVLPFILRGVNLLGVDSVEQPLAYKSAIWQRLAGQWRLPHLDQQVREVGLTELSCEIDKILAAQQVGRVLVRLD